MQPIFDALGSFHAPVSSLGLAFIVFGLVAYFGRRSAGKSRLGERVQGVIGGQRDSGPGVSLLAPSQLLRGRQVFERLRQWAIDWFGDHIVVGDQKRLQLLQAGFRRPNTYLYFELVRIVFGLAFAAFCVLLIRKLGFFRMNLPLGTALSVLSLAMGLYLPGLYLRHLIVKRRQAFVEFWDDALGLLVICLDAGLSIEIAMRRITHELAATAPVLAEELMITVTDLSLRKERKLAYQGLAMRMDVSSVKSVSIALVQAEKQGASIANALRIIAQTNRDARITQAEERAASLGPKMTVPMILFFLPVVFIIIMAPMVLKALQ